MRYTTTPFVWYFSHRHGTLKTALAEALRTRWRCQETKRHRAVSLYPHIIRYAFMASLHQGFYRKVCLRNKHSLPETSITARTILPCENPAGLRT